MEKLNNNSEIINMKRSTFSLNQLVRNTQAPSTNSYVIVRRYPGMTSAEPAYDIQNKSTGQIFKMVKQSNLRMM